jgi:hypothetical protein
MIYYKTGKEKYTVEALKRSTPIILKERRYPPPIW